MSQNPDTIITRLAYNAKVFENLLMGVPPEQARWKPTPEKWSLLEVVNHLYDEEREDFRRRLDYTLHRPDELWPPIDPPAWAITREYNARDLDESIRRFTLERAHSVTWLRELSAPDWQAAHEHPQAGRMTAIQLLANWLAHDYIHIRQMTRLQREYLAMEMTPLSLAYAGNW